MKYWIKEANANNYRKELMIRYPDRYRKEWAFKSREELLEIIKDLIKNDQWIIEDTEKTKSVLIEIKNRAYWETLTIPKLKEQIMFRGQRFTGAKVKKDYLEIMYSILGI